MDTSYVVMLKNTLFTGVLPALAVFGALVFARKPWRGSEVSGSDRKAQWLGAVGLAVGYVICDILVRGMPELGPTNATGWLVHVSVLAAGVGVFEAFNRINWVTWVVRLLAVRLVLLIVLGFMFEHHWSGKQAVIWLDGLSVVLVLAMGAIDRLARQKRGPLVPGLLVVLGIGAALMLVNAETASLAQMVAGLTAACGGGLIASVWDRNVSFVRGFSTVFVLILSALSVGGYFLVPEAPTWPAIALICAPLALWVGLIRAFRQPRRPWISTAIQVTLFVIPVVVAVFLSFNPPAEKPDDKNGGADSGSMYENLE